LSAFDFIKSNRLQTKNPLSGGFLLWSGYDLSLKYATSGLNLCKKLFLPLERSFGKLSKSFSVQG